MNHFAKILTAIMLVPALCSCQKEAGPTEPEKPIVPEKTTVEKVLENIQTYTNSIYTCDLGPEAQGSINLIDDNGAFKDVDYADRNSGNWQGATAAYRMMIMAIAYVNPNSSLKGSDDLYNAISSCFSYWGKTNPQSVNWWYQHIDSPQRLGLALCMMRIGEKKLSDELEALVLSNFLTEPTKESYFTGANKQDISMGWLYLYSLRNDSAMLAQSAKWYFEPDAMSTGDGFQHDYSYLQHGPQFYNLQYGSVPLTTFPTVAAYLDGTSLYNNQAAEFLSEYVENGIIPLHRGQCKLFTAAGRMALSYSGNLASAYSIPYESLLKYMPEHEDSFRAAAQRAKGEQPADYKVEALHKEYWRADYTLHQRPGYTIGMRACSKDRVRKCEINTNGCNHLGYFLSDGGTDICVDGTEYAEIFPVWKWDHVPGVTCPGGYSVAEIPFQEKASLFTDGTFSGGVSDGKYGCSVYGLVDNREDVNTAAHKGYFFFDNETVFLGSNIKSTNSREIHTTVNQCNLDGDVKGETSKGTPVSIGTFSDLSWLCHDNVCYYFPENADITVSTADQTGKWSDVNVGLGYTTEDITKPVFLTYFNHGTKPTNGKYAYFVLPAKASIADGKNALDSIVYGNETNFQWVYNQTLDMLQAIFYAGARFTVEGITVSAAKPCAIMITNFKSGTGSTLSAADPSYSLSSVVIKIGDNSKTITFDTSKEYQGKTVSVTL